MPLDAGDQAALLRHGEMELVGRMAWSSNATFLVNLARDGVEMPAVYKPRRGERPLWDFPHGTLCEREVAAAVLSDWLGWSIVPPTVLRKDGPYGDGMVQRFVDHDPEEHYFTLLEGREERLREFAVFDVLANNADRKGGHVLRARTDGHLWGIDHGLTFHVHPKLRTVIWDFGGEALPDVLAARVRELPSALDGELGARLADLLSPIEIAALCGRAITLMEDAVLPEPDEGYHSVPWPLV